MQSIDRYSGVLFNAFFALFALFLQAPIVAWASGAISSGGDIWLSLLILVLFTLDFYAIYYRLPLIARKSEKSGTLDKLKARAGALWVGHAIMHIILGIVLIIGFDTNLTNIPIAAIVFPVIIIKELLILGLIPIRLNPDNARTDRSIVYTSNIAQWISTTLIYVIIWNSLIGGEIDGFTTYESLGLLVIQGFVFVILMMLFLLFYIPIQWLYVLENATSVKNKRQHMWWYASLLLVGAAGVLSMVS